MHAFVHTHYPSHTIVPGRKIGTSFLRTKVRTSAIATTTRVHTSTHLELNMKKGVVITSCMCGDMKHR
jgi:hypothetical protein